MTRRFDVLKNPIVLFTSLCFLLILYQLFYKNTDFLCQINPPELPVKNFEEVQRQKYSNLEINIYNRSDFTFVQLNPLKTSAHTQQKIVDNERYGSQTDRRHNVSQYCSEHMATNNYLREANANVGRNTQLVYFDFAHSFLFCQIQKVGSSTWNTIMLRIRDIKNVRHYQAIEKELGISASRKRHFLRDTM